MRRVVITGLGVVSALANDVTSYWNKLVAGENGISKIEAFPEEELPVHFAGEVKNWDPVAAGLDKNAARRNDRYAQFAMAAALEAMNDSGLQMEDPSRLGCYIGSGIGGIHTFIKEANAIKEFGASRVSPLFIPMMIGNIAAGNVAIMFNAQGPCLPTVTACATSSHAIGEAFHAIKNNYADAIIAGGTEAAISPLSVGGFFTMKALSRNETADTVSLPFDARRAGFTMGEGAGVLILEEYEHAKARGAKIYAEICGYGNTCDAHHITAPRPDGSTQSRAIKLALEEAGWKPGELLYCNAHGTGTPLNDKAETMALKMVMGEDEARKALISSSKSMTGHCLGAAGALEAIVSVLTLKNEVVTPTINLLEPDPECDLNYTPNTAVQAKPVVAISNNFGFGGQNASIAFRKI
ncbi:MAG: beta-ketoacyl-ACP synthase II [Bacteroidales bacterium]|nr:beta-ketoacyl-ACP synthase II [Bacteroidales bacterium]